MWGGRGSQDLFSGGLRGPGGSEGVPGAWRFLASWSLGLGVTGSGGVPDVWGRPRFGESWWSQGCWGLWRLRWVSGSGVLGVSGGSRGPHQHTPELPNPPFVPPQPPCAGARGPSAAAIIGAEDEDFENDIEPVSVGRGPWGNPLGLSPQILTPRPLPRPPRSRTANSRAWSCCGSTRCPSWPSCSTSCSSSTPAPW